MQLKIKEIRNKKNLTQDYVSEKSGIKKRTYTDYESGKTDIPISKLQNIAKALDVSIYELIGDENGLKAVFSTNEVNEPNEVYVKNSDIEKLLSIKEQIIIDLEKRNDLLEKKYLPYKELLDDLIKKVNAIEEFNEILRFKYQLDLDIEKAEEELKKGKKTTK